MAAGFILANTCRCSSQNAKSAKFEPIKNYLIYSRGTCTCTIG